MELKCYCGRTRTPAKRTLSDGRIAYGTWCNNGCGQWTAKKQSSFSLDQSFVEYDEETQQSIRDGLLSESRFATQVVKELEQEEWWRRYEIYLKSEVWENKRMAVLKRDRRLCQSCLVNLATQVHHLKYPSNADDLGSEPACDLISVCRECHERIHGRSF